jgi:excisionase family DNA binding protein
MPREISAASFSMPASSSDRLESDLPLVVTIKEATRLLSIGRTTLYKLMSERDLTTVKIGGASRILRSSLNEYVKRAVV